MSDLTVEYFNEAFIKCKSEDLGLIQDLSDFFTFQVPGASFMPSVRAKRWDGKIRLFSKATGKIYGGLLPYITEFCRRNRHTIILPSSLNTLGALAMKDISKFCDDLSLKTKKESLTIRNYQLDAIHHALNNKKTILLSPTASGKSLIIYCIIRMMKVLGNRCLLIVPTTNLVEQMYSDFKDYGWNAEKYCHRKYYGYENETDKPVMISTWQSLATFDKSFFTNFQCVIGDEAHLFKSKELQRIMSSLINAKYRIGTTGTLDDSKTHKLVLEGLFGTVKSITTTRELIDDKQLADLKIQCIVLKYPKEECVQVKKMKYQEEMEYIVTHKKRNKFITNLAKGLDGNTLVLFQFVEKHGKNLFDVMKKFKRKVFFVYGGTETKDRETVRSITENEKKAIIVASFGTFSTGINIRNLHNIIFASPSKSRIRNLQSIGRGLRLGDNKKSATLYDISDDFGYKSYRNYTMGHFMERINTYSEQEFDYEIHNIDLI